MTCDDCTPSSSGFEEAADAITPAAADLSAVPLPAGLPLLLAGLGAFAALRAARRST
ncbi:VPLPA-CTERM sorting domain-containing protein [Jannaschia seohaensis]|uniref:VPLPA-CTERM sorting domain-containing protein n=1 Tax=Jannaschia seohaensis TaxID=475081 RepID=UPI001475431D